MSSELIKVVRDWGVVGGALLVVGPIAGAFADSLRTVSGLEQATPLTAGSTINGVLVGLVVMAIAVGYGMLVGRIAHVRLGLICAGLVLTWPAWQFGRVAALVRDAGDLSPVADFIVEGALFGALAIGGALLILRFGRAVLPEAEPQSSAPRDWVLAAVGCAAAAALGAWLIAQSPLQGQVYAAAVAAGVAGGAAGRSLANHAPMLPILVGGCLLAVIGPLVAQFGVSGDPLARLFAGDWPGLGLLTPFDWLAGIFVGVPLGEMWANSMLDRQSGAAGAPTPA